MIDQRIGYVEAIDGAHPACRRKSQHRIATSELEKRDVGCNSATITLQLPQNARGGRGARVLRMIGQ